MRLSFSIIFLGLIIALGVCAFLARRSHKAIGLSVSMLLAALLPPVFGNLIIISSGSRLLSTIGCYIYFLGMDLVMYALLRFTFDYCLISWPNRGLKWFVYLILCMDALQLICNPVFGHAFDTEAMLVGGSYYYRMVPLAGQTFHRIADYGVFAAVLIIFFIKMVRAPRIYSERYSVILFTMIFIGLWETFYIFSRTPIDRSMIGFGVFGLLVFFFALYYKPVRLLDRMLANIASEMPDALFFFDALGRCIWANNPGMALTGIGEQELEEANARLREIFGDLEERGQEWSFQCEIGPDREALRYYVLERHTVTDAKGRMSGSFISIRDNTDEQQALARETYNATHDSLTGLYSREHLYRCIRKRIQACPDVPYLLIFVNVNGFKIVNDIFGNDFGDYALRCIADWIRKSVPAEGLYGRLAGDTFGVCIPAADFAADRMEEALSGFIVRDSANAIEHHVLVHLGVYEITEPELDVSVMFDRARIALSTIKDEYQTHIAYYDDEMRSRVLWNQHISSQLGEAIAQRQIRPYLQPIVDQAGKVVGCEALVRWIHPVDGFLSPAAFIPVFEKNGMIAQVDKYMWRCACEILSRWKKEGLELFISINVSPKDFYFMDVAAEIKNIVREFDVDPARLRVEITETVMMTDMENRIRILGELKEAGFLVEMDDFGSGYSSLNMLKDMPVDLIKIDMMFLNKSKNESKAQRILHNIIHLSGDLEISALTEGVETEEQYRMLASMGCRLFQGYYFAKPMPLEDFERFLTENKTCGIF